MPFRSHKFPVGKGTGPTYPKPRALSGSMCPNCGIRGHWKVDCPNPLQESAHPLPVPSRSPWTQLCPASLDSPLKTKGPRASGLDSRHLCGARVTHSGRRANLFSYQHGSHLFCHACLSPEKPVFQISVVGADSLVSTPQVTEPLPCTFKMPLLSFIPHTPKPPQSLEGIYSPDSKAFLTTPNLSPNLARLLLLEPAISSRPHYPPPL